MLRVIWAIPGYDPADPEGPTLMNPVAWYYM